MKFGSLLGRTFSSARSASASLRRRSKMNLMTMGSSGQLAKSTDWAEVSSRRVGGYRICCLDISMSTSSRSNQTYLVAVVIAQFQELHNELRLEVNNRDEKSLNWTPCSGANSVATIVTHTLGSEAETLRAVAGVPGRRNRDVEFTVGSQSQADLLDQIRRADSLLDDLALTLADGRALSPTTLPTLSSDDRRPGITWLVGNLGHAREHMGHLRLTVQLYDANFEPRS